MRSSFRRCLRLSALALRTLQSVMPLPRDMPRARSRSVCSTSGAYVYACPQAFVQHLASWPRPTCGQRHCRDAEKTAAAAAPSAAQAQPAGNSATCRQQGRVRPPHPGRSLRPEALWRGMVGAGATAMLPVRVCRNEFQSLNSLVKLP